MKRSGESGALRAAGPEAARAGWERLSAWAESAIGASQACRRRGRLERAKRLHARVCNRGLEAHSRVGNYMVPMFVWCGSVPAAHHVFGRLLHPNEHAWTSLISGYARRRQPRHALALYRRMQQGRIPPSQHTLVALLKAAAALGCPVTGRLLHGEAVERGFDGDAAVGGALVDMYAKCGLLPEAQRALDQLPAPARSTASWTALIAGYARHGPGWQALACFGQMRSEGFPPDAIAFACVLRACSDPETIAAGREMHAEIRGRGLQRDTFVGSALVDMYAKCGSLSEARKAFDDLPVRDAVTWSALISGYAEHGPGEEALSCFRQMQAEGIPPDPVTFVCILKACGRIGAIDKGREIHADVAKRGLDGDLFVCSTLVDMYAKCGSLPEARRAFDRIPARNAVAWNALISGYAEHGPGEEALNCFEQMRSDGICPDSVTFICTLKACGSIGAVDKGREIHREIASKGLERRDISVGNTVVDMYAKCGSLVEATEAFDSMPFHDVVSWTALISGHAEHGSIQEAQKCFEQMQAEGVSPNVVTWNALLAGYADHGPGQEALKLYEQMRMEGVCGSAVTFVCTLKACGIVGAIEKGREIHTEAVQRGYERDRFVCNSLVDMYAKCGSVLEAERAFEKLPDRDVVSWNAMINGYGVNHEDNKALECFKHMQEEGMKPNAVTFTCLLATCSRAGLIFEGLAFLKAMREEHGIVPREDHYTCVADLLARFGLLSDAEWLLDYLPCPPSVETLTALLSACKTYGDAELGLRCFQQIVRSNPESAFSYVLMGSVYATAGRMRDAYRVEELRKLSGAKKKPASACIEVNDTVHEFLVGGSRTEEISAMIELLGSRLKEEGHAPDLGLSLKRLPDAESEASLCEHAEKVAVAFGLLNTPEGRTLRVVKNMRMCSDCHSASEALSRIEKRDIVIRDSYCVHYFKAGSCSCTAAC